VLAAAPCLCKAVADTNAAALDKGLDAILAYLARANEAQAARLVPRSPPSRGLHAQVAAIAPTGKAE
jgi:hypothetical protein